MELEQISRVEHRLASSGLYLHFETISVGRLVGPSHFVPRPVIKGDFQFTYMTESISFGKMIPISTTKKLLPAKLIF